MFLFQVFVYDDDFIRRVKGVRVEGLGKESSLGAYIGNLRLPQVVIFHSKFSKDKAVFPLFALKTLTSYLGGWVLQRNAEKAILVEKQFAVRTFGQAPGVHASRSKYFLTYVAFALSCGIRNPKLLLPDYGKSEILRSQR